MLRLPVVRIVYAPTSQNRALATRVSRDGGPSPLESVFEHRVAPRATKIDIPQESGGPFIKKS